MSPPCAQSTTGLGGASSQPLASAVSHTTLSFPRILLPRTFTYSPAGSASKRIASTRSRSRFVGQVQLNKWIRKAVVNGRRHASQKDSSVAPCGITALSMSFGWLVGSASLGSHDNSSSSVQSSSSQSSVCIGSRSRSSNRARATIASSSIAVREAGSSSSNGAKRARRMPVRVRCVVSRRVIRSPPTT